VLAADKERERATARIVPPRELATTVGSLGHRVDADLKG
jgi:hypothetical protein